MTAGQALPIFDTRFGKIGILICFDLRPPWRAARVLALGQGAELIVLPTNWPEGAEISAAHLGIARAAENRAKCLLPPATESGSKMGSGSSAKAKSSALVATSCAGRSRSAKRRSSWRTSNLRTAQQKRMVAIPGKYETEVFASRNPELYGPIVRG